MRIIPLLGLSVFLIAFPVFGQELRPFTPIRTKAAVEKTLPPGAKLVEQEKPLPERALGQSINAIADTWNSQDFKKLVSDSFYDKSRLADAMNTNVPRDARLKVLSAHNASILHQAVAPDDDGGELLISRVVVVTKTQAEFTDPKHGFIYAPGTNEMVIEIVEKLK